MNPVPKIDAGLCERLVSAAANHCAPAASVPQQVQAAPPQQANFDALAASFAALSNSLTVISILIALIAIIAAGAWGYLVKQWAEKAALEEAKKCVSDYMKTWGRDDAPGLVAAHMRILTDASVGDICDGHAADAIGKEAG